MGVIICDSACDLWVDQIQDLQVVVVDFPYNVVGQSSHDKLVLPEDYDKYFENMSKGVLIETQPINSQHLKQVFETYLKQNQDVLFVHSSSAMTTSYDCLEELKQQLSIEYPNNKIYTFDTLQVSMGAGVLVYRAAKLNKANVSIPDILKKLQTERKHIACYFAVDKLDYLKQGTRVSNMMAVSGSMLGVKPILRCDQRGKLTKVDTTKGRRGIVKKLLSYLEKNGANAGDSPIVIMHAWCEEDARLLKEEVIKVVGEDSNVWIQPIGAATGAHAGPKTLGLVFRAKNR